MKGLKALSAVLVASGLLASAVPATAGAAAYKHYVGCGISRNATPSHVCPARAARRAPSSKASKADVAYSVCVKFPSGKNLCAQAQEADPGHALRQQDHLDDPRQAHGQLVRQGQKSRLLRLPGQELGRANPWSSSASTPRPPTPPPAPGATARSLHESQLGLSPGGRPRHATGLLAEVERAAAAAGGWQRGRPARGRARPRLLHRPADRHRHRPRPQRQPRPAGGAGSALSTRSARGIGEAGAAGERLAVLDGFRGEVFAALYAAGGERLWEPFVCRPEQLAERVAELGTPPSVAGLGGGTISGRAEPRRRPDRRTTPIPSTGSPRATSARWRRSPGTGRRPRSSRSTSDPQTRSGGVSEILSQRAE